MLERKAAEKPHLIRSLLVKASNTQTIFKKATNSMITTQGEGKRAGAGREAGTRRMENEGRARKTKNE